MRDQTLLEKLSERFQPITIEPGIKDINLLSKKIRSGFVYIRFEDTEGKTELGIELQNIPPEISSQKPLKLLGNCSLDFHQIICEIEVELESQKGKGIIKLVN